MESASQTQPLRRSARINAQLPAHQRSSGITNQVQTLAINNNNTSSADGEKQTEIPWQERSPLFVHPLLEFSPISQFVEKYAPWFPPSPTVLAAFPPDLPPPRRAPTPLIAVRPTSPISSRLRPVRASRGALGLKPLPVPTALDTVVKTRQFKKRSAKVTKTRNNHGIRKETGERRPTRGKGGKTSSRS